MRAAVPGDTRAAYDAIGVLLSERTLQTVLSGDPFMVLPTLEAAFHLADERKGDQVVLSRKDLSSEERPDLASLDDSAAPLRLWWSEGGRAPLALLTLAPETQILHWRKMLHQRHETNLAISGFATFWQRVREPEFVRLQRNGLFASAAMPPEPLPLLESVRQLYDRMAALLVALKPLTGENPSLGHTLPMMTERNETMKTRTEQAHGENTWMYLSPRQWASENLGASTAAESNAATLEEISGKLVNVSERDRRLMESIKRRLAQVKTQLREVRHPETNQSSEEIMASPNPDTPKTLQKMPTRSVSMILGIAALCFSLIVGLVSYKLGEATGARALESKISHLMAKEEDLQTMHTALLEIQERAKETDRRLQHLVLSRTKTP